MFDSVGSPLTWGLFLAGILVLLAVDLGVFHRKAHRVTIREAAIWSVVWVALSLCFNAYIWTTHGDEAGLQFLSAYLIEKALSVDNIFVFIVLFRYMKVPREHLHRVLFAGILGALVLRGVFIVAGLALIELVSWTIYLFGAFLLYTGIRLLFVDEGDGDGEASAVAEDNWVKKKVEAWLRVTREYEGPRFFVRRQGKLYVTTLFVTLLMVETADVMFALDSIPAIFGITTDPFLVFTSNVCAVLGLRAMFFLLENIIDRFHYLKYGLGLVLSFVGVKMILAEGIGPWLAPVHIPIGWSLGGVAFLLVTSILASLILPPPPPRP